MAYWYRKYIKHWLKTHFTSRFWGWLESLIVTLFILAICFWASPQDPFFSEGPFPWIMFAPVLIALRYGMGPGLVSMAITLVAFLWTQPPVVFLEPWPKEYFLGGLILTLLCGEFRGIWTLRVRRAQYLSEYAENRLATLSKTYFVTRISHDRLERNLITRPVTLRSSMETLRELLNEHEGKINRESASRFLQILGQFCSIESGAIFTVEGKKIASKAIAYIGNLTKIDPADVLIQEAMRSKKTNYVAVDKLGDEIVSDYLVCVPVCNTEGVILAVVVIESMPFLAMQEYTLQSLTVLVSYFADQVWASRQAADVIKAYPDCDVGFATELIKLISLKHNNGVDSALVGTYIGDIPEREDVIVQLRRQLRGLDYLWETQVENYQLLMVLMPFANTFAVEGYFDRIEKWLKDQFNLSLKTSHIKMRYVKVEDIDPNTIIHRILKKV
ncbi:MAG: hypothetical protein CMF50_09065 [Legionellales bacterium]|nr:hypothetical protein [Legionellales bacterium]|tara:strand:+ start:7427 stop:8758 length:1332 start_codon:yes stop_codon:yes gene_type:complete